jgi:ABC-2 type transport system ATP-binding protein
MNDTTAVLQVEQLEKTFHIGFFRRRVRAVRSVSFEVGKGEIFGLLGPNGAGKTTTLKSVMGLIRPTRGRIRIHGEDGRLPRARTKVGYLPENPYFHEYLTPRELLAFHGRLAGLSRKDIAGRADQLIEKVGLQAAAKRPLRKFSKGMLQRVGLAQAIMADPELLILDEPMSGLDPVGRRFMVDLMQALNRKGATILFSSHILSDVERLCHRVVILNRGEKAAEGTIEALLSAEGDVETFEDLFMRKAFSKRMGDE